MGFTASEQVEPLTYDFRPYLDMAGTAPEPTGEQISAYRKSLVAAFDAIGLDSFDLSNLGMAEVGGLIEKSESLELDLLAASEALCSFAPGTLTPLPYRIRQAFAGWVMGVFFSPEDSTPVTRPSQAWTGVGSPTTSPDATSA